MNESVTSVVVTSGSLDALRKTRPWVLFLGIMSIVGAALFGLDALVNGLAIAGLSAAGQTTTTNTSVRNMYTMLIVMFAFDILILVLFAIFHLRYAGAIRRGATADASGQTALDDLLVAQRNLWILMGVVMLVGIIFGIGFTLFAAVAGFRFPGAMLTFPH